jgi:hypothetical protein
VDGRVEDRATDAELEQLLEEGLGAAGRRGGRAGAGRAGAAGGGFGARVAARFLRTTRHEQEIAIGTQPADDDARLIEDVLGHLGRVVWTVADADGGRAARAVIGAGWLGMNPAVVDIRLRPGGRVIVRAAAKEGLIRQGTAKGAVRRVVDALTGAAGPAARSPDRRG